MASTRLPLLPGIDSSSSPEPDYSLAHSGPVIRGRMGRSLVRGLLRRRPCHCERSSRWPAPPAGLMYLLDPDTGAHRRALVRAVPRARHGRRRALRVWGLRQLDDLVEALAALAQR